MKTNHYDVLIIGAGLSGIGMACQLTSACPKKTYAILERRQDLGGTWDLFKYPGLRSDSDMYTFGFHFRPWTGEKVLADGPAIKQYLRETAQEYGVEDHIVYGMKVLSANWSSRDKCWQLEVESSGTGEVCSYTTNFMVGCSGYYNPDQGYKPDFPGEKSFKGPVIHPQHWPENLDYSGKKVVVIGSGATSVTLVPAMTDKAAHVTMLQRSPTYMMTVPVLDPIAGRLQKVLPAKVAYKITRARNIFLQRSLYHAARKSPGAVRRLLQGMVSAQLGKGADMRHFTPTYNPWDERLCAVQGGDLFKAIKAGKVEMVTDHIDCFTKNGIRLQSGKELEADIIVAATGLNIQMMGGVKMTVDGQEKKVKDTLVYKNVLVEGAPNAGMIFGYTNLPWTMKADIASEYICRLLNHMDKHGYQVAMPEDAEGCATNETLMGALDSGYIRRAADKLPRQGSKMPWIVRQNYLEDVKVMRFDAIADGFLRFDDSNPRSNAKQKWPLLRQLQISVLGA
ncbi:MAG: NAD(P)/FAD-dependent oxidoreductase [Paraperlucidibaca sp.]